MKKLIILSALVLAGCQSTQVVTAPEVKTISIPEEYFDCPVIRTFPKPDTLTDAQVSNLLITAIRNNRKCKNSLDAIKEYQESVNSTILGKQ